MLSTNRAVAAARQGWNLTGITRAHDARSGVDATPTILTTSPDKVDRRGVYVGVGRATDAASGVLLMDIGPSFRSRTGRLLAAVGIAGLAACSGDSTAGNSTSTTVPVPTVSAPAAFRLPKLDPAQWQKQWTTVPGSSARRCVRVKNRPSVRSNSFIVGNFRSYIRYWDGTLNNSKLAYTPLYPEQTPPPLMVSAKPLDGQPAGLLVVSGGTDYAWAMNGMPFYATGTLLPHRGRWQLVATAGRNWGCFALTL